MQSTGTRLIKYGGKASLASLPSKFKDTVEAASKSLEAKVRTTLRLAANIGLIQSTSIPKLLKPRYSEFDSSDYNRAGLRETTADYHSLEVPSRINLRRTLVTTRTSSPSATTQIRAHVLLRFMPMMIVHGTNTRHETRVKANKWREVREQTKVTILESLRTWMYVSTRVTEYQL